MISTRCLLEMVFAKVCKIEAALECALVTGCIQMLAWDNDDGLLSPGETSFLEIKVDGVSQAVLPHDYTTSSDGVNKSTWYTPWIAAINALPEWSITLVNEVALATGQGKPEWRIDYNGAGGAELRLCKSNSLGTPANQEQLIITAAADGTLTGTSADYGSASPFASEVFAPCA